MNLLLAGDLRDGINNSQYDKVAIGSLATYSGHTVQLVELDNLVKTEEGSRSTRNIILY